MSVRSKKAVRELAAKHFKEFGLPMDITHKSYVSIVGSKEAVSGISVKRSYKYWKYLLAALKRYHPELVEQPKPAPAPKPAAAPKAAPAKSAPAPKPKAASVKKES